MASKDINTFVNRDLRNSIIRIMRDYKRRLDNGELFNIFVSAGIEEKENYMRNFLAELLREDGSHGMGDFFQESFVHEVLKIDLPLGETITAIHTEDPTNNEGKKRRIDITIETNNRFIPIEVKINAKDQNKQCWDYYQDIEQRNKEKQCNQTVLYYLTKDVHHRVSKESQGNLKINEDMKYIYFKEDPEMPSGNTNDIVSWLGNCLEAKEVKERKRVYLALLQCKESIESWFNKESELKEIRDAVINSLKEGAEEEFTVFVDNYSENDPVILKIKECYDYYYKEVVLEHEFFGGIDHGIEEKYHAYIELIKESKNSGSKFRCLPLKEGENDGYGICLNVEKSSENIYVGYSLSDKRGEYVRYKGSKLENDEKVYNKVLGFSRPKEGDIFFDDEWPAKAKIDINCNDIKKLVFNKEKLKDQIEECVKKLAKLLEERYGETKNEQPLKTI